MANVKIPELVAKTSTAVDDLLLLVDSADSNKEKKLKIGDLTAVSSFTDDLTVTKVTPESNLVDTQTFADGNNIGSYSIKGLDPSNTESDFFTLSATTDVSTNGGSSVNMATRPLNGSITDFLRVNPSATITNTNEVNIRTGGGTPVLSVLPTGILLDHINFGSPLFTMRRGSTQPAAGTLIARIAGDVSASGVPNAANLDFKYSDITADAEFGSFEIDTVQNGVASVESFVVGRNGANYSALPLRVGTDSTANELDDYEEGTWTPAFFGDTNGDATFHTDLTQYVKVGKKCTSETYISIATNTNTEHFIMSSIPFFGAVAVGISTGTFFAEGANIFGSYFIDTGALYLYRDGETDFTNILTYQDLSGSNIRFELSYITTT